MREKLDSTSLPAGDSPRQWERGKVFKSYKLEKFLGGGATSFVWLAERIDDIESQKPKQVAIKILKPETASEWRESFEDEIRILRQMKFAEEKLADGVRVFPDLAEVSPRNALPAYEVMEYVPHPGVDGLVSCMHEAKKAKEALMQTTNQPLYSLGEFIGTLLEIEGMDQEIISLARKIERNLIQSQTDTRILSEKTDEWFAEKGALEELDIAIIGAQTCRGLQLLHEHSYTYKDLQFTNVRYDQKEKNVKLLDFNVVTKDGRALEKGIPRDLDRLASYLFWSITSKRAPEGGASARKLAIIGGPRWTKHTSLALRLVLERALNPNPSLRFQRAHNLATEEKDYFEINPFSSPDVSLGEALQFVADLQTSSCGSLVGYAGTYSKKGWANAALAMAELARDKLAEEKPSTDIRKVMDKTLSKIEEKAKKSLDRPAFEAGRRYLEAANYTGAETQFIKAIENNEQDLEAHRWLAVVSILKQKYLKEAEEIKKSGLLFMALDALEKEDWDSVLTVLKNNQDFEFLAIEARVGKLLSEAAGFKEQKKVPQFVDTLKQIRRLAQDNPQHPYLQLHLERYPWSEWEELLD